MVVQRVFTDRPRLAVDVVDGNCGERVVISAYEKFWLVTQISNEFFSPIRSEWYTTATEVHARVVHLTRVPIPLEAFQEDLDQLEFVSQDFPQVP
jgi:hypothetical protein